MDSNVIGLSNSSSESSSGLDALLDFRLQQIPIFMKVPKPKAAKSELGGFCG